MILLGQPRLEELSRHDVIPQELRAQLKGLGGFRNILVHHCLRLDPEVVAVKLRQAPGDFSGFGAAVRDWLEALTAGSG